MTSNDQDVRRKRKKLSLSTKTPTRLKGGSLRSGSTFKQVTPKSSHSVPLLKKSLRNAVKNVESSDDSTLEIGWDNNSPSPSTYTKPGRRKGEGGIAAMLKIPRTKRIDIKEGQSSAALKTWMQDDLAVCKPLSDKSIKGTSRKSRNRSQRRGAKSFNEELKSFIETIVQSGESNNIPIGSTPHRRSLCGVAEENCDEPNTPNESPIHLPLFRGTIETPLLKNSAKTPLYESPIDAPDQFDNINWSVIDTPGVKGLYENDCDNDAIKPTTCTTYKELTNKNRNVFDALVYEKSTDSACSNTAATTEGDCINHRSRSPLKTTGKDNNAGNIGNRLSSCRTLYVADAPCTGASLSSTYYTACNDSVKSEPACKIPKTDTVASNLLKGDTSSSNTLKTDAPSSKLLKNDITPSGYNGVPCNTSKSENIVGKTLKTEIAPSENSLMNIDFDDDLDEILSSQDLDLSGVEKENVLPSDVIDITMDDDPIEVMCIQDGGKAVGNPLTTCKDNELLANEVKDVSMLLEDDFPTDIILDIDTNKTRTTADALAVSGLVERPVTLDDDIAGKPLVVDSDKAAVKCTIIEERSAIDLVGFDEADDLFDDIIMGLDSDAKCKSQGTPPRNITPEQRKLKNRCNTSPFPLNSKSTLLEKKDMKNAKNDSVPNVKVVNNSNAQNLSSSTMEGMNFLTLNNCSSMLKECKPRMLEPSSKTPLTELDGKHLQSKTNACKQATSKQNIIYQRNEKINFSSRSKTVNGYSIQKACSSNNTQNLNNNNFCIRGNIPLDLSVIARKDVMEEEDVSICIPNADVKSSVLSSTQKHVSTFLSSQKCSMDQIQRKRAEAQLKLKQKNRWKK